MELLILKIGQDYVRVREDQYETVGLDKASVFPKDKLETVKAHQARMVQEGADPVCIKKLVLSEKDL